MNRKLRLAFFTAPLAALMLAGCGGDNKTVTATKLDQTLPPPPVAGGAGKGKVDMGDGKSGSAKVER